MSKNKLKRRYLRDNANMQSGGFSSLFSKLGNGLQNVGNALGQGFKAGADQFLTTSFGAGDVINSKLDELPGLNSASQGIGKLGRKVLNVVAPGSGTALNGIGRTLNAGPSLNNQQNPFGNVDSSILNKGIFNQVNNGQEYYDPSQIIDQLGIQGLSNYTLPSNTSDIGSLLKSLGIFQQGGKVNNESEIVDIQAEKNELIFHPTSGALTDVHARRSHKEMERSKDGDMITDHPLSGSFIFSDFLKVNKKDADDLVIGIKRYSYDENKKGKEPEIYSLGDLMTKKEKKLTPADLARRVKNRWSVRDNNDDLFDVIGDNLNTQNRIPYLEAISLLSELEKEKSDSNESSLIAAKKGGKVRKKRIRKYQTDGEVNSGLNISDILSALGVLQGGTSGFGLPENDQSGGGGNGGGFNLLNSLYKNFGRVATPVGGAITTGANFAGAAGSFNLYNNLLNENEPFFNDQRTLANESRDIASQGNLFDVGLGLLRQGPEDLPINNASRVSRFNPFEEVNNTRRLANQSIGQINSLIRNNPDTRGLNIGSAIASNNQAVGNSFSNAFGRQFEIDQFLDSNDFNNANIEVNNRQRRTDFGNALIDDSRGGFRSFFSNEASRPLDQLGLNNAERQSEIGFREQRLHQPINYLSTAGQSLSNLGAQSQALANQQSNQGGLANILGNLDSDTITKLLALLG